MDLGLLFGSRLRGGSPGCVLVRVRPLFLVFLGWFVWMAGILGVRVAEGRLGVLPVAAMTASEVLMAVRLGMVLLVVDGEVRCVVEECFGEGCHCRRGFGGSVLQLTLASPSTSP